MQCVGEWRRGYAPTSAVFLTYCFSRTLTISNAEGHLFGFGYQLLMHPFALQEPVPFFVTLRHMEFLLCLRVVGRRGGAVCGGIVEGLRPSSQLLMHQSQEPLSLYTNFFLFVAVCFA